MPSSESKQHAHPKVGVKKDKHVQEVLSYIQKIDWRVVAIGLGLVYFLGMMGMVLRTMMLLSVVAGFFALSAAALYKLIGSVVYYAGAHHEKETARDVLRVHLLGKNEFDVGRLLDVSGDIHITKKIEEDATKDIPCRKILLRRSELESQHVRAMFDGIGIVFICSLGLLLGGLIAAIITKSLLAAAITTASLALTLGIEASARVITFMALRKSAKAWTYNRMVRKIVLESEKSDTKEESRTCADEVTPVVETPTEERTSPVEAVGSGKNDNACLDFDIRNPGDSSLGGSTKEGFGVIGAGTYEIPGAFSTLETNIFATAYRDINGFGYCHIGTEPSTRGFFVTEPIYVAVQQKTA